MALCGNFLNLGVISPGHVQCFKLEMCIGVCLELIFHAFKSLFVLADLVKIYRRSNVTETLIQAEMSCYEFPLKQKR